MKQVCTKSMLQFLIVVPSVLFSKLVCLNILQVFQVKVLLRCVSFYFLSRLAWSNTIHLVLRTICTLPWCGSTLPFACLSNSSSINKPIPLQLNVSFPSFQELKWSIARLYYLFNIQLERNIGM